MLKKYSKFKPFTEAEAWALFRLAAFGEAIGWTILITGLLLAHFLHNNLPVLIAGQFHGLLFLIYLAAAVSMSPSLGWPRAKIMLAAACSVPPYGTLLFELWQSHNLRRDRVRFILHNLYLAQLAGS